MRYHTIFLDAGGVLVHPNWERVSDTLERHDILVQAQALRDADPLVKKSIDRAEIIHSSNDGGRFSAYLRMVISQAGVAPTDAMTAALAELYEYNNRWNLWENVPNDVLPTLAALRARGMKLVVVSNSNGTLRDSLERLGLLSSVDMVFDSHEHNIEKPNPEYFLRALKASGGTVDTTVHIGDFYHIDVIGARSAGMDAILLDSANLYEECDCPRIKMLGELITLLE